MNRQFEKTENSMSIYYATNRILIALHIVLFIYFLFLRVYCMAIFSVGSIILYIFCYKLLNNRQKERYFKITYYEVWLLAAGAACIMGMEYGFHLALIAMLLPVALSIYMRNGTEQNDNRFFKCYFKKKEGIVIVVATVIVHLVMQVLSYYKVDLYRFSTDYNGIIARITFMMNMLAVIIYIFYYLNTYSAFVNKNEEFLRQKADYDQLTGLYNRNRIRFILEHNYSVAQEGNNEFGVAIMDIDDFKKINDNYGHNAGDFVLKRFAGIVDGIVKKCEGQIVAGRWGGEEFLIIYYGNNREDFYMLLEYIRMNIYDAIFLYDHNKINVSVTIGMTLFKNELSLEEIINDADMRLYAGKKSGKNKVM